MGKPIFPLAGQRRTSPRCSTKWENHLTTWPNLKFPHHIVVTANQEVWVSDNQPDRSRRKMESDSR